MGCESIQSLKSLQPEREPDSAAADAAEPLEGRIPHGARQAEGQLVTRRKGAEEEPGTLQGDHSHCSQPSF